MTLSEVIINYRTEHSISQRQMAAQCGLSAGYISLIEKEINPQTGKRMVPTLTVLNKLAKGMGITIDDLLAICDDMPVSITDKSALFSESGLSDDIELATLILQLSPEKKREAVNYLRYLAAREDP